MSVIGDTVRWIVGIDEVGRGPLAGPVAVGVVLVPTDFDWDHLSEVNDSKKLSEKKRNRIAKAAQQLKANQDLFYSVVMKDAQTIDEKGIVPTIAKAIEEALDRTLRQAILDKKNQTIAPETIHIMLDGGLRAPAVYVSQETITKGDAKEAVIGLASILAKVERDTYMCSLDNQPEFDGYGFAQHKGYGTVLHRTAIATQGLTSQHRASYCKNINFIT